MVARAHDPEMVFLTDDYIAAQQIQIRANLVCFPFLSFVWQSLVCPASWVLMKTFIASSENCFPLKSTDELRDEIQKTNFKLHFLVVGW